MPADNKFYKYFVVYPFNVLSISKITVIESVFNIIGILLSLASISTSFVTTLEPASVQSLTHILTLSIWIFSAFWAWRETYNNVSNLFISEWGQGGEETEIEYLEQHF
uniref:Transmembrane protein n=1 Tax=Caenorhabditis tropicalis TaxID=1561998 RepID=A0A1I7UGT3_9PELO